MITERYKLKSDSNFYWRVICYARDPSGKRHQKQYSRNMRGQRIKTKREAENLAFEYTSMLRDTLSHEKITFKDWLEKFLTQIKYKFKRSTIHQYNGDLKKWLNEGLNNTFVDEIKKSDIEEFIFTNLLKNGASPHTQKRILRNLKRVLEAAVEEGLIQKNPSKGISVKVPKSKKKVLNTQEVQKLLQCAQAYRHEYFHVWAFALFTGMRNGEIYALRWHDVDNVTGIIRVSASWSNKDGYHSTKNQRERIVPISNDLRSLLLELKNLGPFSEELKGLNGARDFFDDLVLPRCRRWKNNEQAKETRAFCKQIGITEVNFHDLRATFITNMLAQGVPLPQVMSIVGHARTSTTDEYLRLAGVDLKGTTEKLGYSVAMNSTKVKLELIHRKSGGFSK